MTMYLATRLRRSALFVPAGRARAIEKSRTQAADVLLFDLEDAVAPANKQPARQQLTRALNTGNWQCMEKIVRINTLDSSAGQSDIREAMQWPVDGILLPKTETPQQILQLIDALEKYQTRADLPLWIMVETPAGILHLESLLACSERIVCVIIGTNDLATRLRTPITTDRYGLLTALSLAVLTARQYPVDIIDGVYNRYQDLEGLQQSCNQGRKLGFDGKSLIHPGQIETANACFSPNPEALEMATNVLAAEHDIQTHGVTAVGGQLLEQLHLDEARRLLRLHQLSIRTG